MGLERAGIKGRVSRHLRGRLARSRGARALGRAMPAERVRSARLPPAYSESRARSEGVAVRHPSPLIHGCRDDITYRSAVGSEVGRVALRRGEGAIRGRMAGAGADADRTVYRR